MFFEAIARSPRVAANRSIAIDYGDANTYEDGNSLGEKASQKVMCSNTSAGKEFFFSQSVYKVLLYEHLVTGFVHLV